MNTNSTLADNISAHEDIFTRNKVRLYDYFSAHTAVLDAEKGYISVPWVNRLINTELQSYAAEILIRNLPDVLNINKVCGLPTMGAFLAVTVAQKLSLPLAVGRKGEDVPVSWTDGIVVRSVDSFTTKTPSSMIFTGLEHGDHVLFIDDIIAHGNTALSVITAMKTNGIQSSIGAYCAKLFQGGVSALRSQDVFVTYAVGIEALTKEGLATIQEMHEGAANSILV